MCTLTSSPQEEWLCMPQNKGYEKEGPSGRSLVNYEAAEREEFERTVEKIIATGS